MTVKESKSFDISTIEGLKKAERYQQKLYTRCDRVIVQTFGLSTVLIIGYYQAAQSAIHVR